MTSPSDATTTFDPSILDASAEAAPEALKQLPDSQHEAVVRAWIAQKNAAALDAVVESTHVPASTRKAAKRALGVLRSRGITVDRKPRVVSVVSKPVYAWEARALFPDGRGARMFWIARTSSSGGAEVVEVTVADRVGIVDVQRGNPSLGNLRQLWQSWSQRSGRVPFEVPLEWARQQIARAKEMSVARKAVLPMGIDAARELLGDLVPGSAPHPIEGEDLAIPTAEEAVNARLANSMNLHEEPEFFSWLPDDNAVAAMLQNINEKIQALGGTPEPSTVQPIIESSIEDAANAYFDEERKRLYPERLRDSAFSLLRAGKIDRAIDAIVVARGLERAGIVSDRPSEIGFVRGMFTKAIAFAQQRAAEQFARAQQQQLG